MNRESICASQVELRPFLRWTLLLSWGVPGGILLLSHALLGRWYLPPIVLVLSAVAPTLGALCAGHGGAILRAVQRLPRVHDAWPLVLFAALSLVVAGLEGSLPKFGGENAIIGLVAPFGEEFGWKIVLLPWLLARMRPAPAGLIAGLIWIAWHLPGVFIPGLLQSSGTDLIWWGLGTLSLSLLMVALFVRSDRNVWTGGVLPHLVVDWLGAIGLWRYSPAQVLITAGVASGLWILGWARPVTKRAAEG